MIESVDKSVRYILKYKPFTYLLACFMALFMAELYPKSNSPLPKILGILFQSQILRLTMLIIIIYVSQYNYYLSSIITIMLISSYMLSDDFAYVPLEGFTNNNESKNDSKSNNSESKTNNNSGSDDVKENYDDIEAEYDENDYIDLDEKFDDDKDRIKEKYNKFALLKGSKKEVKTINQCIELISTLPSDNDDTYKVFLQNIAAQRKAYLDMIKNKTNNDDIEAAKEQYRKMLRYLTEEFLDKLYDDEDYEEETNNDDDY